MRGRDGPIPMGGARRELLRSPWVSPTMCGVASSVSNPGKKAIGVNFPLTLVARVERAYVADSRGRIYQLSELTIKSSYKV